MSATLILLPSILKEKAQLEGIAWSFVRSVVALSFDQVDLVFVFRGQICDRRNLS